MIGKQEELVLLAILKASKAKFKETGVYAVRPWEVNTQIVDAGIVTHFAAVYQCMSRMAAKGLLHADDIVHKGQNRREFVVSATGHEALEEAIMATTNLGGMSLANVLTLEHAMEQNAERQREKKTPVQSSVVPLYK